MHQVPAAVAGYIKCHPALTEYFFIFCLIKWVSAGSGNVSIGAIFDTGQEFWLRRLRLCHFHFVDLVCKIFDKRLRYGFVFNLCLTVTCYFPINALFRVTDENVQKNTKKD